MRRSTSPEKPDRQQTEKVLRELQSIADDEYTIVKISEPISSAAPSGNTNDSKTHDDNNNNTDPPPRTSDVSTASLDAPTPSSLEADLAHYRELFAKLRFSYVEQVTKEKFIRAIVGDPPLIVTPQENADLEASNAAAKAQLKAQKTEMADMVRDLERRGRALAARYEAVREEAGLAADLPAQIAVLEARVRELRARQQVPPGAAAEMNMPLGKTREAAEARRAELAALERQLELVGGQVPRKRKELERLRAEVAGLENKKANSAAAAREAKRRRENAQGGVEDELEARGRWYRASETVLRQVLDLQG